jgi:transposase
VGRRSPRSSLALLSVLDDQIRRLDATLAQQWGHDLRVQRLMTIPGIGRFLAVLLVLELGDVQRFPSGKHLASYIGLTPRIRASADRVRSGHISKEGNRLLRWGLGVGRDPGGPPPRPLARLVPHIPEAPRSPRPAAA